ncbi:hypothetical protein SH661x_003555 [Planctomicrobium sp. SH661]|uniref:hypothetical protein n=1 Tax=Planctomicrobium sp. SH661 TaxID=3448124 RepID=UPI003F5AF75A
MAVSWASSMQFAGCLNNPTHPDLAGEAGKAALRAEQDLAKQKVELASAKLPDRPDEGSKVVAAGGEVPQEDSPILQTGSESPEKKKSFWSFLSPKSDEPAVKDPFADQPELKPSEKATAPASGKARLASSSTPAADAPTENSEKGTEKPAEKDPYSADNWFEKEFAGKPEPSDWEKQAAATSTAAAAKAALPNKSEASLPARAAAPAKEAGVAREMPAQEEPWMTRQPAAGDSTGKVSLNAKPAPATEGTAFKLQQKPSADTPNSLKPAESPVARQQKLRVQALLSDAHTSSLRGEFHAAYRSALLAERIASENQITFAEGEENPHEFAKAMAAKIWRTSNTSDDAYLAATEVAAATREEPKQNPKPEAPVVAKSTSAFPDDVFATWEPLPDNIDQRPALATRSPQPQVTKPATAVTQSTPTFAAEALPEIRPWNSDRVKSQTTAPRELSQPDQTRPALSAPSTALNPAPTLDPLPETRKHSGSSSDPGVQFAIAHTVSEEGAPSLLDPFDGHGRANSYQTGSGTDLAAATLDRQRPLLMAPPTPVDSQMQLAEQSSMTWDELSQAKGKAATASQSKKAKAAAKWRVMWSLLGLAGAGIAAFVGVRFARSESRGYSDRSLGMQDLPPVAVPASPAALEMLNSPAPEDPAALPLQFKRAA